LSRHGRWTVTRPSPLCGSVFGSDPRPRHLESDRRWLSAFSDCLQQASGWTASKKADRVNPHGSQITNQQRIKDHSSLIKNVLPTRGPLPLASPATALDSPSLVCTPPAVPCARSCAPASAGRLAVPSTPHRRWGLASRAPLRSCS
jgi:hypothetical protein